MERSVRSHSRRDGVVLLLPALQVKDTGKPLPDRERDGTGLRLRSCRAIVELHGGVMTAYARSSGTAGFPI